MGFVIVLVGLYSFFSRGKHFIILLLSLEYVSLGVFILLTLGPRFNTIYFPILFLIFVVCEGVVGLSLLVSLRRAHGRDMIVSLF